MATDPAVQYIANQRNAERHFTRWDCEMSSGSLFFPGETIPFSIRIKHFLHRVYGPQNSSPASRWSRLPTSLPFIGPVAFILTKARED